MIPPCGGDRLRKSRDHESWQRSEGFTGNPDFGFLRRQSPTIVVRFGEYRTPGIPRILRGSLKIVVTECGSGAAVLI